MYITATVMNFIDNSYRLHQFNWLTSIYPQKRGKTMSNLNIAKDFRLLLAETICLEAEHFALANQTSSLETANAENAWQVYLNTLALLALEIWLNDRFSHIIDPAKRPIERDMSKIAIAGSLKLCDYKFCAISTEHLSNEIVSIPQEVIRPDLAPHFYVLLEVLEEEEEVIIRGFLPHNELIRVQNDLQLPVDNGCYQIPLSYFDIEPNHVLTYYRYIQAPEFTVPIATPIVNSQNQVNPVSQISEKIGKLLSSSTTKLSQWLEGVIDESWQTVDSLANPELGLAFSTRNINREETKRAKIIDLGIDIGSKKFALLVNISPDISTEISETSKYRRTNIIPNKISVLAQLHPLNGERFLPQNLKLMLISKAGTILQEVTAKTQDNYIQLKLFKGEPGKQFSIQVSLGNVNVKENFEF
jgi:Protein of unknown function (DUF1822)